MKRMLIIIMTMLGVGLAFAGYHYVSQPTTLSTSHTWLYGLLMTEFLLIVAGSVFLFRERWKSSQNETKLISDKSSIELQLQEQTILFDTLFRNSNVGIAILSLEGHITRVNQALLQLLGYSEPEMLAMNYYYLIHPSDLNELQNQIQRLLDEEINVHQSEQQCFRKNGEMLWTVSTLTLVRDHERKPIYFMVQVLNVSMQKKAEERLRHMAYHDPLTGLANRNKLEQFINHMLASSRRQHSSFAVLFLDLDRFKTINDTIGHEAGDTLLQIVAERLRSAVRNTDMVARLGGDEFVVLITDVRKSEAAALIAQKILQSIMQAITIKGQEIYITTSIGISLYPYDGQNLQTLMKNADLALYRSKEHGRNNYEFYTTEMTGKAQVKLALQNALGHALAKNEFLLNYQPMMDLKTRKITGIEAFLRWRNPEYGNVTPDEMIALAEETGLIIPVSDWILKTACQQLKRWHDMGLTSLTMAVNCSARQFKQANFVNEVLTVLNETGLPPQSLEIEVTESIIMEDTENTLRTLYALKDLGVQIVIDDFGTGYWSLGNLRRLSVDKIKIDKTFIKQITYDEISATITIAMLAMLNKLGIKSVAEGVETREQYEFLAREGCKEIQGYYLTQPLSDELMGRFLRHPTPDAEVVSQTEVTF